MRVCVWECVWERERERSVSGLWSLTPCFAPACGLQESLYLTLHVVHTHTHGALCQLCTQPGPNLPEHPLKETFSALFLDTRRVCVNSAGFSFSFHDREVFLTHFWLNIAHRNTLSPEQAFLPPCQVERVCVFIHVWVCEHLMECNYVRCNQLEADCHGFPG